jgi:hypothetical protein
MLVDIEIAVRLEVKVESAVAGEELEHVIKKANAS